MWQCGQEKKKRGQVGNKKSALLPKYFLSISVNMTNIGCTRAGIKVEPNNQVFRTRVSEFSQFLWQDKIHFFMQVKMDVLWASFFSIYFLSGDSQFWRCLCIWYLVGTVNGMSTSRNGRAGTAFTFILCQLWSHIVIEQENLHFKFLFRQKKFYNVVNDENDDVRKFN